jgi:hypothetical protein
LACGGENAPRQHLVSRPPHPLGPSRLCSRHRRSIAPLD